MKLLPVLIGIIFFGAIGTFLWAEYVVRSSDMTVEDNLTLLRCSGDRFSFIQGTYLHPVTEEEIEREKAAVLSRVNASGGPMPRAGGTGGGGGGPGPVDPRIVAWGYCVDYDGIPTGFNYGMGRDSSADHAVEKSNQWYQDKIVNRSLDANATCDSRTVVERFRRTGMFSDSLVRDNSTVV
jgi:hypothetical protein